METTASLGLTERVRSIQALIRERAPEAERLRRMPDDVFAAMREAGFARACVPRELGGDEVPVLELLDALEEAGRADGSAGWVAMIYATSGTVGGFVEDTEPFDSPDVVIAGVSAPTGRAEIDGSSYRASGRWKFASGCTHADWLVGGCLTGDPPDVRMLLFPRSDVEVIDTWDTSGLRGTGSHDIAVRDAVVPRGRTSWFSDTPRRGGALYRMPQLGLLASGVAAVAIGIARSAIDELRALATDKTPTGSRRRLADRGVVQAEVAKAEAVLGAGRAYLHTTAAEVWAAAESDRVTVEDRARLRLAATHATRCAAQATDAMYESGGGTSIYAASRLQRDFRDVHAATQHIMVAPPTYELVGRLSLGIETDTSML